MAQLIRALEAKTSFAQIIDNAKDGADFIITTHEKPVIKIIPFKQEPEMTWEEALEGFRELRKLYRGKPGSFNIREAIEEGRR